jgi:hypothetical protein
MISGICLLLIALGINANKERWDSHDVLIEDSLGTNVVFAADYNYSNGNIYVACIPDSGTYFGSNYWGLVLFRSTDHGLSWDLLASYPFISSGSSGSLGKAVDLVATRADTLYVLLNFYSNASGREEIDVAEIYFTGSSWNLSWMINPNLSGTEILSPKLVRDDFDDFYLYMAYLDITPDRDSLIILCSEDRGYNWSNVLRAGSASNWLDQDIAVADSSLYHLSVLQGGPNYTMQLSYWRDRGNPSTSKVKNPLWLNTRQIQYPRIGVTTTIPDSQQLVYAFYSRENPVGDYDLLYLYSEEGGDDWPNTSPSPGTVIPDTLALGSFSPILCDLRGYQAELNQWMDITYCLTSSAPSFENFWCWASEGDPANWQETASVATGANRSFPELVYSPGASGSGAVVVYNDSLGNLWFDAPWRESGIAEYPNGSITITRSQIALAGSLVEIGSTGAIVYDVTGREIIKLNTESWDLRDRNGNEVKGGIYFIVNSESGERVKISLMK